VEPGRLMATTFRSDVAGAIQTLLTTYQTANPTLLRQVHRSRPSQVTETPSSWIGEITETLQHTSGVRFRRFSIPVIVVDMLADNSETLNRLDDLVDALVDVFTANPQVIANTLIEPVAVSEVEIDGPYHGVAISVSGQIQEGRL
jgi:hypothetical protein